MEDFTRLQDLPPECLALIISHLKAEDVVSVMRVSRTLRTVASSETVWKQLNWRDFGIHSDAQEPLPPPPHAPPNLATVTTPRDDGLTADDARRGRRWNHLYAAVRSQIASKSRVLRVQGLFTDGGCDENEMENWVAGNTKETLFVFCSCEYHDNSISLPFSFSSLASPCPPLPPPMKPSPAPVRVRMRTPQPRWLRRVNYGTTRRRRRNVHVASQ